MKRRSFLIVLLCLLLLAGCGKGAAQSAVPNESTEKPAAEATMEAVKTAEAVSTEIPVTETQKPTTPEPQAEETPDAPRSDTLVVYFSRTGEQYNVGVIDKGNTAIVAKMIAEETNADLFEILPEEDSYPYTYRELTDAAKREQNEHARPAIGTAVPDLSPYTKIFIGAPVWWGDWPMILYTFFEGNAEALKGKTLIPFSTHEGSGLSGFDKKLMKACPESMVLKGLAVTGRDAQNDRERVRQMVKDWLTELG